MVRYMYLYVENEMRKDKEKARRRRKICRRVHSPFTVEYPTTWGKAVTGAKELNILV